jgi:hypothetical protein
MDEETPDGRNKGDGPRFRITEAELDSILERIHAVEPPDFQPPSDEAVLAYLDGTATAEEREAVRRAWLQSRMFRQELMDLAHDLDALEDPADPDEVSEHAEVPESPGWERFRANHLASLARRAGSLVRFVQTAFSPLPNHMFAPIILRGPAPPLVPSDRTPEEAAIRNFMSRVQWRKGAFRHIRDVPASEHEEAPQTPTVPTRTLHVLQHEGDQARLSASFEFPATATGLTLWLLFVPSLALYNAPVELPGEGMDSDAGSRSAPPSDATPIVFSMPVKDAGRAFFALTFAVPGGYLAVRPLPSDQP